ncbi:MAG: ABC transporter permease, partial [Bacillota bacterium]
MIKDTFKLFIGNKKALIGLIIFLLFLIIAIFAPIIAPYEIRQSSDEDGQFPMRAEPGG